MMNTTETLPLAVDHALLWRALEPALAARGLLDGALEVDGQRIERREVGQTLAWVVAMERRVAVRLEVPMPARVRRRAERIRERFRRQARVFLFMLGVLPVARVRARPLDAGGHDPEIAEWFGVDPVELAAATHEALRQAERDSEEG